MKVKNVDIQTQILDMQTQNMPNVEKWNKQRQVIQENAYLDELRSIVESVKNQQIGKYEGTEELTPRLDAINKVLEAIARNRTAKIEYAALLRRANPS